jgi:HK97 family phage major capsid protein
MNMMKELRGSTALGMPRGLVTALAEAPPSNTEIKAALDALQRTFAEFREANDEQIRALKPDPVQAEKVDKLNAEVGSLQEALDQINMRLAASQLGGGAGDQRTPEMAAYLVAMDTYYRRGATAGLGDLAVRAELATDHDTAGGYLVGTEMETEINRVVGTTVAMRRLAQQRNIGRASYKKLFNQGGASSGWVGERSTRTETVTPELAELEYVPGEIYAEPHTTQEILDDGELDVEGWLRDEVAIEFAEEEGAAFINGNGVKKPRGILQYDTVINTNYAWGKIGFTKTGAAAAFAASDPLDAVVDLIHSLKAAYRQNATFMMNDLVLGAVRKFKDGDGNYMWQPSIQAGQPSLLFGYPVETDDNMPDLSANVFPVAFGDFRRAYLIVDRVGVRTIRDDVTTKGRVKFYTTKRVGGGIQNFEAIKLLKCAA